MSFPGAVSSSVLSTNTGFVVCHAGLLLFLGSVGRNLPESRLSFVFDPFCLELYSKKYAEIIFYRNAIVFT